MEDKELIRIATETKEKAYAPYSQFRVGAALLTEGGQIFTGVNIESASYGATVCAERTAVFKAVSEGEKKFKVIAIASDSEHYIYPCGICRQILAEFNDGTMKVLCSNPKGDYQAFTLNELLPMAFHKSGGTE